jgi:glycerol uptake facilitator-like aquaporin
VTLLFARRSLAEAAGTAVLVAIGTGSIVGGARLGGVPQWTLAIGWFLAVLIPIALFVRVSGAHLNPAVTLALAVSGRIRWTEAPAYWVGQFVGAFAGSALVLASLGGAVHLGATVPKAGDLWAVFLGEAGFTAGLILAVFVLEDQGLGDHRWRLTLPALVVGVSTLVIGPWTGSSLNPARTLAPAVLSGTYVGIWIYLTAVPLGAMIVAFAWRSRALDPLAEGLGERSREADHGGR